MMNNDIRARFDALRTQLVEVHQQPTHHGIARRL